MNALQAVITGVAIMLTVACGGGGSTTSSTPATATNTAPVARVGADQSVSVNTLVTLDGSTSSDANNDPLSYAWTLGTKPTGSLATLSSATVAKPTFTADVSGTYVASLVLSDGKAISTYSATSAFGPAVKIQTDGRIVVAGKQFNGNDDDILVQRFYSNGTPNTSFGTGGATVIKLSTRDDNAKSLVIQSDGKIVIAGGSGQSGSYETSVVLRMTADGVLDSSFGSGGKVLVDFGVPSHAHSVVVQSDGKLVMTGETYTTSDGGMFALVRYLTNGSLDTSFGTAGMVTTVVGSSSDDWIKSLAIQSWDGTIVAAGYSKNGSYYNLALTRYSGGAQ